MKIICTEKEKEWIKKLMLYYGRVDDCKLECDCRLKVPVNIYDTCWRCIEENVEFEIDTKKLRGRKE